MAAITREPLLVSDLRAISAVNTDSDDESEDQPEPEPLRDLGGGFCVRYGLPRCRQEHYTLRQLMIMLDKPDGIDLNPVYQRDVVWKDDRQSGLINSLLRDGHVPSLIFNNRTETILGTRSEVWVCIDGKQRLTSLRRFTQGQIPCWDDLGQKWWFQQENGIASKSRKYLSQQVKDKFWAKKLGCDIYSGMSDDQEHETFEIVQRGNPLTPAERARAKKRDWFQLARDFKKYERVLACECRDSAYAFRTAVRTMLIVV